MKLTRKHVGGFLSVLLGLLLAAWGCQRQEAQAPTVETGSVRTSEEVASSTSHVARGDPALPTSDFPLQTSGETTETAPQAEKMEAKAAKAVPSELAVELALKFSPGPAATYRVTTEAYKSVEWQGPATGKPAQFTDGRTGNHVELTFEQKVQQRQEGGNAVLEITIRGLRYVGESVNKVVFGYDSARPQDANSPLAALIGQSYTVKMSAQGQVLDVSDTEPLWQAVQGSVAARGVAIRLLSQDEIRNRHEITTLSVLEDPQVRPGQSWSSIRTFSFADMGIKTYERIYTLQQVQGEKGAVAVVEMKAIPSAALAEELHKQQRLNPFVRMSDNTDKYEGTLKLDLERGEVREYVEQMQNEWTVVDPSSTQQAQPTAIKMVARRLHRLERIP